MYATVCRVSAWHGGAVRVHKGVSFLVLLSLTLAGCGGGGSGKQTNSDIQPWPSPQTTITPSAAPAGDTSACPLDEIRPVIEHDSGVAEGLKIDRMEVVKCVDGYANVAIDAAQADPAQVILKKDGQWKVLNIGTSSVCATDDEISTELRKACLALDLQ